jgi:hypothetical protein
MHFVDILANSLYYCTLATIKPAIVGEFYNIRKKITRSLSFSFSGLVLICLLGWGGCLGFCFLGVLGVVFFFEWFPLCVSCRSEIRLVLIVLAFTL